MLHSTIGGDRCSAVSVDVEDSLPPHISLWNGRHFSSRRRLSTVDAYMLEYVLEFRSRLGSDWSLRIRFKSLLVSVETVYRCSDLEDEDGRHHFSSTLVVVERYWRLRSEE